jgi:hypothetical protein
MILVAPGLIRLELPSMGSSSQSGAPMHVPVRLLFLFFVLWKVLLFIAILCSPGPGYDTSATLLKLTDTVPNNEADLLSSARSQNPPLFKLVRWDAIYYSQLSQRGHVFEQEWAFGVGLSRSVSFISTCKWIQGQALSFTDQTVISQFTGTSWALQEVAIAIVLSHVTHFLTVLLLYALSRRILKGAGASSRSTPTIAASLHIISPAGAFLSAPYSESLFSTLNFLGFYLYLGGRSSGGILGDFKAVLAGFCFGSASVVRSNGLLGGLLFVYDVVLQALDLLRSGVTINGTRKLIALGAGGLLVGTGAFLPQYEAYRRFCGGTPRHDRRPWCDALIPSIYGWVQRHYWFVHAQKSREVC